MPRVICTTLKAEVGPHLEIFSSAGFECDIISREINMFDLEQRRPAIQGYQAIVSSAEPYTRALIESLPDLRVIARTGVGFDAIDLEACDDCGIAVTTTPGVNHDSVAEHTIALLFALARGIVDHHDRVRSKTWKRITRPRVQGRTLGIIGLGRIGRAVAWRAAGLGMKLVVFEPDPNIEFVEQWNVELAELDELLARSDYVSLHLPLSPETHQLINKTSIAMMKPGAVLINTARGALVDETALYEALKSGHLRGAALDVFRVEPLSLDSPLQTLDNVVFTGHIAGLDDESHDDMFRMAAETVVDLHSGGWPDHCIQNLKNTRNWSWTRD